MIIILIADVGICRYLPHYGEEIQRWYSSCPEWVPSEQLLPHRHSIGVTPTAGVEPEETQQTSVSSHQSKRSVGSKNVRMDPVFPETASNITIIIVAAPPCHANARTADMMIDLLVSMNGSPGRTFEYWTQSGPRKTVPPARVLCGAPVGIWVPHGKGQTEDTARRTVSRLGFFS